MTRSSDNGDKMFRNGRPVNIIEPKPKAPVNTGAENFQSVKLRPVQKEIDVKKEKLQGVDNAEGATAVLDIDGGSVSDSVEDQHMPTASDNPDGHDASGVSHAGEDVVINVGNSDVDLEAGPGGKVDPDAEKANRIVERLIENGAFAKAFEAWKKDKAFGFNLLIEAATTEVLKELCDPAAKKLPTDVEVKKAVENMFTDAPGKPSVREALSTAFALMEKEEKDTKKVRWLMKGLAFGGLAAAVCTAGVVIAVGGYGSILVPYAARAFMKVFEHSAAVYNSTWGGTRYKFGLHLTKAVIANPFNALQETIDLVFGYKLAGKLLATGGLAGIGSIAGFLGVKKMQNTKNKSVESYVKNGFVEELRTMLSNVDVKGVDEGRKPGEFGNGISELIESQRSKGCTVDQIAYILVDKVSEQKENKNAAILDIYSFIHGLQDGKDKQDLAAVFTKCLIKEGASKKIFPKTSALERAYAAVAELKPAGMAVSLAGMLATAMMGTLPITLDKIWDAPSSQMGAAMKAMVPVMLEPLKTPLAIMTFCLGGATTLIKMVKAANSVSQQKAVQQLASLCKGEESAALRMFVIESALTVGENCGVRSNDVLHNSAVPQSDRIFLEKKLERQNPKQSWVKFLEEGRQALTQRAKKIF